MSLRRRSECQSALESCSIPQDLYDEDVWYSACLAESGKHLPHSIIANRFSTGSKCQVDAPFGVHKLWQNCKESTCVVVLMMSQLYKDTYGDKGSDKYCSEGNMTYLYENEDVKRSFSDGWVHYQKYGKGENRMWKCMDQLIDPSSLPQPYDLPKAALSRKTQRSQGDWVVW